MQRDRTPLAAALSRALARRRTHAQVLHLAAFEYVRVCRTCDGTRNVAQQALWDAAKAHTNAQHDIGRARKHLADAKGGGQ